MPIPTPDPLPEHAGVEVDPADLGLRQSFTNAFREDARAAADVEQADRLVAPPFPDPRDDRAVGRAEEQALQDATVVALAPTGELVLRLVLVVTHQSLLARQGVRRGRGSRGFGLNN